MIPGDAGYIMPAGKIEGKESVFEIESRDTSDPKRSREDADPAWIDIVPGVPARLMDAPRGVSRKSYSRERRTG